MEEPEAHLHSDKQRKMGDIMSLMVANGAIMQITTHSENLLQRLQELSQLGYLKEHSSKEKFAEVCKKVDASTETVIQPDLISGYHLKFNDNNTVHIDTFDLMCDTLKILMEAQKKSVDTISILNKYVRDILNNNNNE